MRNKPPTTLPGTITGDSVQNSIPFATPGIYRFSLTVGDDAGNSASANTVGGLPAFVVIYDPSAGFVTGGGRIHSPPGALHPDLEEWTAES
jgi:hypothetical protein